MNFWDRWAVRITIVIIGLTGIWGGRICLASEIQEISEDEKTIEDEIMGDLELSEVEQAVDELLENDISFGEMVGNMMQGGQALDGRTFKKLFGKLLEEALGIQKKTCVQILFLVIFASVFSNLSQIFQNQQIGEISFYMVYLLLFALLIGNYEMFCAQITKTVEQLITFMKALLPSYSLAITAASGTVTAGVFYQMILVVIFLAEELILHILIPCIRVYFLMELINYLTKEEFLSKMTELLKTGIEWVLKTMIGIILGIQLIQRLISPAVDALKRTAFGKTAGAIPGVGNIFSGVAEIVLGSAVLVKNCIGAAAVVILLLLAAGPLIRLGVSSVFYQFLAALIQPAADKRMVGCIHTMGESIMLLLRVLVTVEILFMLTIAILAGTLG
jgi:stage III sporulation protein AE